MSRRTTAHLGVVVMSLATVGCQSVGGLADSVGKHMPVIGERCENWQCITPGGKAKSDAIKAQERGPQALPPSPVRGQQVPEETTSEAPTEIQPPAQPPAQQTAAPAAPVAPPANDPYDTYPAH